MNLDVIKTWIAKEIISYLQFEDEMLIDMVYNMLEVDEVGVYFFSSSLIEARSEAYSGYLNSLFGEECCRIYGKALELASFSTARSYGNSQGDC